jgi:Alpha galactosidase A
VLTILKTVLGTFLTIHCVFESSYFIHFSCYSEQLFMTMSDLLASEGYLEAGYDFISLDDCWMDHKRSKEGKLQGDSQRFPSGIKALADYVRQETVVIC